jgi:hypothetical protein
MIRIGYAGSSGLGNLKGLSRGEKKHVRTTPKFFEPLARAMVAHNRDISIISESPKPCEDAVMIKRVIHNISKE